MTTLGEVGEKSVVVVLRLVLKLPAERRKEGTQGSRV